MIYFTVNLYRGARGDFRKKIIYVPLISILNEFCHPVVDNLTFWKSHRFCIPNQNASVQVSTLLLLLASIKQMVEGKR